ncbi:MAG: DUF1287 domain-containing protein [Rhizobiaceae bacterium]
MFLAGFLFTAASAGHASPQNSGDKQLQFAGRLADAALERTKHFVVYNPAYFKINYPNGDVPAIFGVCTDVVIRSYRSLGIDLQERVHKFLGGDPSIMHRRVANLKKYFKRHGKSLPITEDPKDYQPGDIVTYRLPKGSSSPWHIAIVSSKKAFLSGRPMIVHNIGGGPKLEDSLFDFKITGHYRYQPDL